MATATLTRTVRVVHRDATPAGRHARFTREPDEPGDIPMVVELESRAWIDMGYPETISVTIEPGDLLNP